MGMFYFILHGAIAGVRLERNEQKLLKESLRFENIMGFFNVI